MESITVFYVEDEPFLGKIVKETLEGKGYKVVMHNEGGKAAEIFKTSGAAICRQLPVLHVVLLEQVPELPEREPQPLGRLADAAAERHTRFLEARVGPLHQRPGIVALRFPARLAPQRVDLAIPSAERIRWAVCGGPQRTQPNAMVVGFARDARDASAAAGVTITGEWNELTFTSNGITRSAPRLVAVTAENGWFALCGVPSAGLMTLTASRGADSSGVVEVQVPADGFLRREMYIASAPLAGDGGTRSDPASAARAVRRGDVRLSGTVRRLATGAPIAGAQVSIAEGPMTLTDAQGEWVLPDAPPGTRMLEVRAVGLYPERLPVDVVTGAPAVHVVMKTFQAVLETINVRAGRLADHRSFAGRRRIGGGIVRRR
mgnify:CR=1 FL=1